MKEGVSLLWSKNSKGMVSFSEPETTLLDALIGIQGRGRSASPQQLKEVERAVSVLEVSEGVPNPTRSILIEGQWQLMFTTRPGTAFPIQRTFVGVDFFSVFQEVDLQIQANDPRVSNTVKFSDAISELKVEVPYPVPFRLLDDEAKGWLDTTYLSPSGNLRVSRGNKGTTFVLLKQSRCKQKLLSAISTDTRVEETVRNGQIKFQADLSLGLRFSIIGSYLKTGPNTYDIKMDDAAIIGGPFGYHLEIDKKFKFKIIITHGYNNILFVHLRSGGSKQA